jgi:hypothetical protein
VPRGRIAERRLEERLVVPQPDGLDAGQPRGELADAWIEQQRLDLLAEPAQAAELREDSA